MSVHERLVELFRSYPHLFQMRENCISVADELLNMFEDFGSSLGCSYFVPEKE